MFHLTEMYLSKEDSFLLDRVRDLIHHLPTMKDIALSVSL